jgi:hypothetical protein
MDHQSAYGLTWVLAVNLKPPYVLRTHLYSDCLDVIAVGADDHLANPFPSVRSIVPLRSGRPTLFKQKTTFKSFEVMT